MDPAEARSALQNPETSPDELSVIAQFHPSLRAEVAMHPAAYPGLLDWLASLGDPLLAAVVDVRLADGRPNPAYSGPASGRPQAVAHASVLPSVHGMPNGGETKKHVRSRLPIILGAGVLVVALVVTGFVTRGFGLIAVGGAATPELEAVKVANKTVELLNSFSAKNLLSNPFAAMGSLSDEYAPSEAHLSARPGLGSGSSANGVDTVDLLGLTGDTVGLVADLIGVFKVQANDVKTEVTQVTDEIAVVGYVEGTVTVTADVDKLRAALTKAPDVASKQLIATAEKYGLQPNPLSLEDELPAGWLEDAIDRVKNRFPVTIDLAAYNRSVRQGSEPPDPELALLYRQMSAVAVVKEGGRWYLSSMLTSFVWSNGLSGNLQEWRLDSDDKRLLSVEPSKNRSPVEAAEALAKAVSSGRERAVLAELPLAERRYAAFTGIGSYSGILSQLPSMATSSRPEAKFSELAKNGDQAKLRIDEFGPIFLSSGEAVGITGGTCLSANGETHCLSDYLDAGTVEDAMDYVRRANWGSFEETTGLNPDDLVDKLETAAGSTIEAVDPDQLGIVAVQEDGNWFISASATYSDLQNQAAGALAAGLKAAQNR